MLKFLATTENAKRITTEEPGKAAGNCYSQFRDIEIHESRAVLIETEGRVITNNEETN